MIMKKTIFALVAMGAFFINGFANNEVKTPPNKENKEFLGEACCRRGVSNSNGENSTIRACVPTTGDAQIDMGKACEKALKAAKAGLEALEKTV